MKKYLFIACSIGALLACNREPFPTQESLDVLPQKVQVKLHIGDSGVRTKSLVDNPNETAISNAILTVKGWKNNTTYPSSSQKIEVENIDNIIVDISQCDYATFDVESGPIMEDGTFDTGLKSQIDQYYAKGSLSLTWNEMLNQTASFEVPLVRVINKISIEKISVNWMNPEYDNSELIIKNIYICDVPRYYQDDYSNFTVNGYTDSFTGIKEDVSYYNFGGITPFINKSTTTSTFTVPNYRLDEFLMDEVEVTVTKDNPYCTRHVFYTYVSNSINTKPAGGSSQGGWHAYKPAMTSIVLETELDGAPMFYRFPILGTNHTTNPDVPINTHFRFCELVISDLGSSTIYGAKGYKSVRLVMSDWEVEEINTTTDQL